MQAKAEELFKTYDRQVLFTLFRVTLRLWRAQVCQFSLLILAQ